MITCRMLYDCLVRVGESTYSVGKNRLTVSIRWKNTLLAQLQSILQSQFVRFDSYSVILGLSFIVTLIIPILVLHFPPDFFQTDTTSRHHKPVLIHFLGDNCA